MCADHRKTHQQNDVDQEAGIKPVTFPRTAITYHVHATASTGSGNLYLEMHDDTAIRICYCLLSSETVA